MRKDEKMMNRPMFLKSLIAAPAALVRPKREIVEWEHEFHAFSMLPYYRAEYKAFSLTVLTHEHHFFGTHCWIVHTPLSHGCPGYILAEGYSSTIEDAKRRAIQVAETLSR
jgi:hypothetical protein